MGRPDGLSDFLTFISPCIIIVLFFLCLFRFLFSCCACKFRTHLRRNDASNAATTEAGINVNSMGTAQHCTLNMPPLPLNYVDYDTSSALFQSQFLFSAERFPPKYEDAIKLPTATPRRSSCSALPLSPPFYDANLSLDSSNDYTNCQAPPAYSSLSRQGPVQGIRPTGFGPTTGLNTISNTTNNAFLVALPSPSVSNSPTPLELSAAMLAEKRLRVGVNAVRHASLTSQDQLAPPRNARPITSVRSSTNNFASMTSQPRPLTMHTNSRYMNIQMLHTLPGQITEANSTRSLAEVSSDSEKQSQ